MMYSARHLDMPQAPGLTDMLALLLVLIMAHFYILYVDTLSPGEFGQLSHRYILLSIPNLRGMDLHYHSYVF